MVYQSLVNYVRVFLKDQFWILLFLLYVNDIADEDLGLCRLFAYDTSIGHSAHDEHTLVNLTDIDLSIKVVRTMAC
jgi:hypothetical protein